jgi:anti-anti-sigma factor
MVDVVENGVVRIAFKDRLDATNATEVLKTISPTLEGLEKDLLLDMSALEYISSAGLQVVLHCVKAAQKVGRETQVSGMNANVSEILNISGFLTFLKEV